MRVFAPYCTADFFVGECGTYGSMTVPRRGGEVRFAVDAAEDGSRLPAVAALLMVEASWTCPTPMTTWRLFNTRRP